MDWFYATKDKAQAGPVDEAALQRMLEEGAITKETLVWRDGMTDWAPLSTRPELSVQGNRPLAASLPGTPPEPTSVGGETSGKFGQTGSVRTISEGAAGIAINSVLSRTWSQMKGNYWPGVGVTLLGYLIVVGLEQIPFIGMLAIFLVQPQMFAGVNWYFLKQFRGESATINDAFEGFRRGYGRQAVNMLILSGVTLGIVLLSGLLGALGLWLASKTDLGAVAVVAGFIVGIPAVLAMTYLAFCWVFAPLLILDRGVSAVTAMKWSRRVVHRHFGKLAGLFLVVALLCLLSGLVLCVGLVFMLPLAFGVVSRVYEDLFAGEVGPAAD